MELQIGEYFIPDGCTVIRVGNTIHVRQKRSNKLPPNEKRCRDCSFFSKGHTVHSYYYSYVCLNKPKKKEGFYYSTTSVGKPCEDFKSKEEE